MISNKIYNSKQFIVGGARANYVLFICALLWMTAFMDRQVISVILQPMKADLLMPDSKAGWITTALFMGIAVFAIPFSYLVDQWSRKKSIGIMAIVWSAATLMTGMGNSFQAILFSQMIVGIGQAGFSSAAMALISTSFPENVRAKKMGIFNLFQVIGISTGLILGGYFSAKHGGWRTPLLVFAVPGFFFGLFAFFMQDYPNVSPHSPSSRKAGFLFNIKRLLKIPTLAWFYLGYAAFTALGFAVLTWSPALIMRKFNVGEDVAGIFMASVGVLAVPGVLVGGALADKWQNLHPGGRMRFAALAAFLCTIGISGFILLAFIFNTENRLVINVGIISGVLLFFLFCITSAAVNPAVMAAVQTVVSQDLKGLVWGLGLSIILIFGGAWSPAATGYLSDLQGGGASGLARALAMMSFFGLGSAFCFWQSSWHYPKDLQNRK